MSRKHYVQIAKVIARMDLSDDQRRTLVDELAEMFSADNSNFRWSTFREACEPVKA